MALIKCSECGKEISDKAAACVHCGCPVSVSKAEEKQIDLNMIVGDLFGGGRPQAAHAETAPQSTNFSNTTAPITEADKKKIMDFIKPSSALAVVMMIPPLTPFGLIILLTTTLSAKMRGKKSVEKLANSGDLAKASVEISAPDAKRLINGRILCTDNFIFCKFVGCAVKYQDILWAYKKRRKGSDMLYIATKDFGPLQVASIDFDGKDEVKKTLIEIYNHNKACIIGDTEENAAKYNQMTGK